MRKAAARACARVSKMDFYSTKGHRNHSFWLHSIEPVISRSGLKFINTSINTFFSKFRAFLAEKGDKGRPVMVEGKLNGAVDESSVDQEICKSYATVHNL